MKYEEEFKEGTNASLFQMSLLFEQKIQNLLQNTNYEWALVEGVGWPLLEPVY